MSTVANIKTLYMDAPDMNKAMAMSAVLVLTSPMNAQPIRINLLSTAESRSAQLSQVVVPTIWSETTAKAVTIQQLRQGPEGLMG